MSSPSPTPLILFSGLAADASVFAAQKLAFPQLVVPRWDIRPSDTLDSFCQRIGGELCHGARPRSRDAEASPSPKHPPIQPVIGGASFGGIVALHLAQYVQPRAVLLIGSVQAPEELPRYARWSRPLAPCIRLAPIGWMQWLACLGPSKHAAAGSGASIRQQFCRSDPRVIRWSLECLLRWRDRPPVDCPVWQIHGARDRILPAGNTWPDQLIADGGHVISATHPGETNAFIRRVLNACPAEPTESAGPPSD